MQSTFHFLLSSVILMAICPTEAAPTAKQMIKENPKLIRKK